MVCMPGRIRNLVHGAFAVTALLPGEDLDAFDTLAAAVRRQLQPAPGLEEELAAELALTLWRLRRLQRAEQAVNTLAMRHYLDEGLPPTPIPELRAGDPAAALWTGPTPVDTLDLGHRLRELDGRVALAESSSDWYPRILAELDALLAEDGVEAGAKHLRSWRRRREQEAEIFGPPSKSDPFMAVPLDGDAKKAVDVFRKAVTKARREDRQCVQAARDEARALRAEVAAVFAAGAGELLDPRAPSLERLSSDRRCLLKVVERLMTTLAEARSLPMIAAPVTMTTQLPTATNSDFARISPRKNGHQHPEETHQ